MTIDIKTSTTTQQVLSLASKNQDLLRQVSIQIASGNKHTDFKGFAEDGTVERLISFKENIAAAQTFKTSNNIVISKIDAIDQSLETLQGLANSASQLIAQRRNSASGSDANVNIQATAILNDIQSQLNVQFDGQFLFSGTKTNTAPVSNIQSTNIDSSTNTSTSSYYQGNNTKLSIKATDTQTVEYSVLANDEAFQDLIGALHLAIDGDADDDDDTLALAVNMINDAVANLASVRATNLAKRNTVQQANEIHTSVDLLISENLVGISQTDIVEATTRMSELQATVQATFLAFTRLNELRLSNFLN